MQNSVSDSLIEEIQQAFTEGEFNSRWALIEAYQHVGTLLLSVDTDRTKLLHEVSNKIDRSVRTLWYCIKFAEMFPDLQKLPEGKNVSMRKIINNYLTDSKQEECLHSDKEIISFEKCKQCGQHLGKVDIQLKELDK